MDDGLWRKPRLSRPSAGGGRRRRKGKAVRGSVVLVVATLASLGMAGIASASTNAYGVVASEPAGGNAIAGGYVRLWQGNPFVVTNTSNYAINDDFWAANASTFMNGSSDPIFIESGIAIGHFCGDAVPTPSSACSDYFTLTKPRFFWGDSRCCGGGLHEHIDKSVVVAPNQYHDDYIQQVSTDIWNVQSGPFSGESTSNPMNASELETGTEELATGNGNPQTNTAACNGQSGLGYYPTTQAANSNTLTHGWPGTRMAQASPPWIVTISEGSHYHDWAAYPSGITQSQAARVCYGGGASGDEPRLPGLPESIPDPSSGVAASNTTASSASSVSASQIKSEALAFAASFGDPTPTSIQHVESSRQQAVFQSSQDVVPDTSDSFLIVVRGSFVDDNGVGLPSQARIPGSVLTIVIDAHTGQVTDFGIQDSVPDLSSLGPVTNDQ